MSLQATVLRRLVPNEVRDEPNRRSAKSPTPQVAKTAAGECPNFLISQNQEQSYHQEEKTKTNNPKNFFHRNSASRQLSIKLIALHLIHLLMIFLRNCLRTYSFFLQLWLLYYETKEKDEH